MKPTCPQPPTLVGGCGHLSHSDSNSRLELRHVLRIKRTDAALRWGIAALNEIIHHFFDHIVWCGGTGSNTDIAVGHGIQPLLVQLIEFVVAVLPLAQCQLAFQFRGLPVAARLPDFQLSMQQLTSLTEGSLLPTGLSREAELEVLVGGVLRYRGRPARIGQKLAVSVTEEISSVVPAEGQHVANEDEVNPMEEV